MKWGTSQLNADSLLKDYLVNSHYDEMLGQQGELKETWKPLLENLNDIGIAGLASKQNDLNWCLSENGVTYNVYNDPQGLNRPWNLNLIPQLISMDEWSHIERGIKQRAELLNLILRDIYGKKLLIQSGLLPQEVIYGHRGFLRPCDQIHYNTPKQLLLHTSEMARGPDGNMWVISDRTQAPSGMGYALENRLTLARVLPDLSKNMLVKSLSPFFQHFNNLMLESHPTKKENPNIVVLTPGPHNETYFEHAYLASFFGISLVQGNDLIVRDGYLWMKSLRGLKQVDVVLRRVDDTYTDPLELREDSQLGVSGLLDVVRRQNVSIINPIGCRILENPGLIPFMPAISKYFLGEDLILPQIATWWCGQEKEANYVMDHLSSLIVKRIDRHNVDSIFYGYEMSDSELENLKNQIKDRPYRFVAQEKINFSTTPTFSKNELEPRISSWRSFAIAHGNEYSVMPGGLVRVAPSKGNIAVSNQKGGTSKDIWIIDNKPEGRLSTYTYQKKQNELITSLGDLPSLTAENLFWAGRYAGRTLSNCRYIRMVLKQMNYSQFQDKQKISNRLKVLLTGLTHLTGTYPGFLESEKLSNKKNCFVELESVIFDRNRMGSLSYTLFMFKNTYFSFRNLWSADMWRVFERIDEIWKSIEGESHHPVRDTIQALDQLITRLIAFMGLLEENILMDQGLRLYYIGLQLEQGLQTSSKVLSLLSQKLDETSEYEILESLLISHESLNIYRTSFRSYIKIENVLELIILNLNYPCSLAYQLSRLSKDLSRLPHSHRSYELADYEKCVLESFNSIRLTNSTALSQFDEDSQFRLVLSAFLEKLNQNLLNTSLYISNRYFSHTYTQNQLVQQNLFL